MANARPTDRAAAFQRYVVPELDFLYRVAIGLTANSADAEDLVQDTIVRAYGAVDRFDGRYPRAWLLTILRNTHINRARRRRPELLRDPDRQMEQVPTTADEESSDPGEVVARSSLDDRIAAALAGLPERFRRPVELVDVAGLSYREAAEMLGVPIGTVMSRLHRARKRMRHHLDRVGFDVREFDQ
jgi:RNA polymerase sigma-70 factor (ECF subfamily)